MTEISETIEYEVQERQKEKKWRAVSCLFANYKSALYIYETEKNDCPNLEFRIRKITTTKRVKVILISI